MIILKALSLMKNNKNMKLKNKLDTNDFFITAKNDNKEITCIYIVFIYIVL